METFNYWKKEISYNGERDYVLFKTQQHQTRPDGAQEIDEDTYNRLKRTPFNINEDETTI